MNMTKKVLGFCASVVFVTMCMLDTTLIGRYSQILKNSL